MAASNASNWQLSDLQHVLIVLYRIGLHFTITIE